MLAVRARYQQYGQPPAAGYSLGSAALASRKPATASLLTRVSATGSRWRAGGPGFSRGVCVGVPLRGGIGMFAFGGLHLGLPGTGNFFNQVERALGSVMLTLAP